MPAHTRRYFSHFMVMPSTAVVVRLIGMRHQLGEQKLEQHSIISMSHHHQRHHHTLVVWRRCRLLLPIPLTDAPVGRKAPCKWNIYGFVRMLWIRCAHTHHEICDISGYIHGYTSKDGAAAVRLMRAESMLACAGHIV